MKVYGTPEYKGYVIKRNRQTKKAISKHYISAVDNVPFSNDKVNIWFRDKSGDSILRDYEIGKSQKIDLAIKTWYMERKKQNRRVSPLPRKLFIKNR